MFMISLTDGVIVMQQVLSGSFMTPPDKIWLAFSVASLQSPHFCALLLGPFSFCVLRPAVLAPLSCGNVLLTSVHSYLVFPSVFFPWVSAFFLLLFWGFRSSLLVILSICVFLTSTFSSWFHGGRER